MYLVRLLYCGVKFLMNDLIALRWINHMHNSYIINGCLLFRECLIHCIYSTTSSCSQWTPICWGCGCFQDRFKSYPFCLTCELIFTSETKWIWFKDQFMPSHVCYTLAWCNICKLALVMTNNQLFSHGITYIFMLSILLQYAVSIVVSGKTINLFSHVLSC